ncbi:MAG: hypothetical protein HOY69_43115 [Streptomyces sp.]|nr:hypothetical protein [Streptomyces sp.]
MRHRTALTAAALGAALAVTALGGCSSSGKKSDDAKSSTAASTGTAGTGGSSASPSVAPSKPAGTSAGHLTYTGDSSGTANFTGGVKCEVKNGKLIGVTTPDVLAKTPSFPAFIATTADSPTQVALFNTPDGKPYAGRVAGSPAVTAKKTGGTWTVTVAGLKVAQNYGGSGPTVTLSGSLTCTRLG